MSLLLLTLLLTLVAFLGSVYSESANAIALEKNETVLNLQLQLFWSKKADQSLNIECDNEFRNVLSQFFHGHWHESAKVLQELAFQSENKTITDCINKVLWQEFEKDKIHYNVFEIHDFYRRISGPQSNITMECQEFEKEKIHCIHYTDEWQPDEQLLTSVRKALIDRSAQIYESVFYAGYNGTNSLPRQVLDALEQFGNDSIMSDFYENLLDRREAVQQSSFELVDSLSIIRNESISLYIGLNQALYDRIDDQSDQSEYWKNQILNNLFENNLYKNLSSEWQERIKAAMPKAKLFFHTNERICLRNSFVNATTYQYLYECPRTTMMCTGQWNSKQSPFQLQKNPVNNRFSFYSQYWSRYLGLQGAAPTGSSPNPETYKIVYSVNGRGYDWEPLYQDDYVILKDATGNNLLCGGNSTLWTNNEHHVYLANWNYFYNAQHECLWLPEEC